MLAPVRARDLRAAGVDEETEPVRNTRARSLAGGLLSLALLAGACGDDDDTSESTIDEGSTETSAPDGEGASGEAPSLDLTLTDDGLEGLPEEVVGGAVEVTFAVEGSREYASLDFTRVDDGTTPEQFAEEIVAVFEGGPFPDFVQSSSGHHGVEGGQRATSTILLEPGTHIVWFEGVAEGDGPPPVVAETLEVTEGGSAELPETASEIVARDYAFEVDVAPGPGTLTFRNEGPDQLHHAVLVDFGTNSVEVAEEAIGPLLQGGEDEPPPDIEGLDVEQVDFDFGGTGIFGPGLGGTMEADLTAGNTYAVVCFISDREGGPPHAIGMEMYDVFQV